MFVSRADKIAVTGSRVQVTEGGKKLTSMSFEGEDREIPQGFAQGAFTIEVRAY